MLDAFLLVLRACAGRSLSIFLRADLTWDWFWQDRDQLIDHLEKRSEAMWKIGTIWTFRNEAKVYGSPMFDAVWQHMQPASTLTDPMPEVIRQLRSAPLPKSAPAHAH